MRSLKLKVFSTLFLAGAVWGGCQFRARKINNWDVSNLSARDEKIVCFGDSLVAGVGAKEPTGSYPAQLSRALNREVIALGKPGETSQQGLKRLREHPEITQCPVIVTLGGNDLLRRLPWAETEAALSGIFTELRRRGCLVAFTGIEVLGGNRKKHKRLCKRNGVILIPDVLGDISNEKTLKNDPIHPNDAGYRIMAERVAEHLKPFLQVKEFSP
ncbi:MAG: GDSL-type esterase/lipase family protein [Lentisphaeria bacterium]|nr:GDSL-type esterase/lipase family protein [Lentisphaeria bacterium]